MLSKVKIICAPAFDYASSREFLGASFSRLQYVCIARHAEASLHVTYTHTSVQAVLENLSKWLVPTQAIQWNVLENYFDRKSISRCYASSANNYYK